MEVTHLHTGPIETNTYLFDCGSYLAVVDPGGEAEKLLDAAQKQGKTIGAVLLTHAHWDHIGAVSELQKNGAKVYIHQTDALLLNNRFTPDVLIKKEGKLILDARTVQILHTPGHTAGSVCYIADNILFSGDTLFRLQIGRCDLPTGDFSVMKETLKKLFALSVDYRVLPGHGQETTLSFEKAHNPYK
ncbi:MAG: MBL fold metallo-hydrolase [Firmicutes bacterium]|nr:MBL fold metallo-hydrolase [Bacillota bacterium]